MMKVKILLFICISLLSCSEEYTIKNVGDIEHDHSLDSETFVICNPSIVKQYYVRYSSDQTPVYHGEKIALEKEIRGQYKFPVTADQNGYLTIRFIVNCKGETGRFRIEEMDFNYEVMQFNSDLSSQLLNIVQRLKGWGIRKNEDTQFDYYQYLTFKIKDGQIITILP